MKLIPVLSFDDVLIEKAHGSVLTDVNKKEYIDLNAGQFCAVLGHSNKEINAELVKRITGIAHTSTSVISKEVVQVAEKINRISGGMNAHSILLSTGAEVIEFCLRYAKHIKKKTGVVVFDNGYHGLTLGAQSVTFSGRFASPLVENIHPVDIPKTDKDIDRVLVHIENIFSNNEIAACLFEPIVSVGGMLFPDKSFFHKVRELCDKHDVFLIFDECQTGFGRTGDWFCYQTYDVVPDMVALAKGIGLGFPVAAALFKNTVVEQNDILITHYSSHQNDPFAAQVINIAIDYIEKNKVLDQVKETGSYFLEKLNNLNNPYIKNARATGLMLGADLYKDGITDFRNIYKDLYKTCLNDGLIIQGTSGGSIVRFLPDFLITKENIDKAVAILDKNVTGVMQYV